MEEWRDISEFAGLYQVSNKGNVRRIGEYKNQFTTWQANYVLTPADNGRGYLYVQLSKGNKTKRRYVHRLVAEAFLQNGENKPCINHKDSNRKNNDVKNLEWCTYAENNNHAINTMHDKGKTKRNTGRTKPVLQYSLGMVLVAEYPSMREAERQTGIVGIDRACAGKQNRTQAGGYVWRYKVI